MSHHDVQIWCGRSSNGTHRLTLTDRKSGVQFVEVEMTPDEFAQMVTAMSTTALAKYRGLDRVGLRAEHKTEAVPFDCYRQRSDDAAQAAALAPLEIDGWRGRRDDLVNGHLRSLRDGVPMQCVTFHRHVHDDGTPYVAATQGGSGHE